ncbi:SDR family NAD(P)-dependent oxidoreductase [Marininema halotolerans]|uniref:Polyketide synthase PksM/polyketide synthase PksN n=1 Tax=Marininema halotolerans TaxID=1155944 RepID=A0A1I6PQA3_9BACL|nr:SDR family NAD(P)-dependent oxidoreductase [Marininema halotolerans]SFS42389.1 polyketide synthase PksM/polyketide synthase PksN [Marininema halotolerans]
MKQMDLLLSKLLLKQLRGIGLLGDQSFTVTELSANHPLQSRYRSWFETTILFLEKEGLIHRNGNRLTIVDSDEQDTHVLWREWEREKEVWLQEPLVQAQVKLVDATIRGLPDILLGKKRATDMMFPNGSMELVEGIYKKNEVADYFNQVLSNALALFIEGMIEQDPLSRIRIIEIGAGSGGTSEAVLKGLHSLREHIEEYCYTDISRAFLLHAEKEYRHDYPFLTCKIVNAELPLSQQDVSLGEYDIVIASNVLHATKDIKQTLRNTKALLRKNGLLLLNEISENSLFSHLTFGLLDGWWLYEDPELRIPGCPGLYPDVWKNVMESEGFRSVFFPAEESHDLGQQIVVAESDGVVHLLTEPVKNQDEKVRTRGKERDAEETRQFHDRDDRQYPRVEEYVQDTLLKKLSEALKIDETELDSDQSFADYGLDSILGVNFVQGVSEELAIELEVTDVFDYSTVNQLSRYIASEHQHAILKILTPTESETAEGMESTISQETKDSPSNDEMQGKEIGTGGALEKEPIAIIGMSGRFAQSNNVDELWKHLANGTDLVRKVSRWDLSQYYEENQAYCENGSLLDRIDQFDPFFFNISGAEAEYMDPQQRIFLEESWTALEDAGYVGEAVKEVRCGVYVGGSAGDYNTLFTENPPPQALWGSLNSAIAARISYILDLQGPAIVVDTACSSSLVAVHLACQGLWTKETDMALAGGVYIQATPQYHLLADRAGMLSRRGHCHTFDNRADGMVPGEAAGAVILKRLSDAVADGDHIYGIIRGSGINQDGTTNGITAPSLRSQERLERQVYEEFGIHAGDIQMVEAHGTGTKLGDPIEFHALSRAFRQDTNDEDYCAIGSIKSNLGHTQIAAGVTSLIKVLLSLKHKQIPPSLHFETGNENIRFAGSPFYVNTSLKAWDVDPGKKRLAVLSAFGASGTNAHMVIEEAPPALQKAPEKPGYMIPLSAQTPEQLRQQAEQLMDHCQRNPTLDLGNISYTLMMGRKPMKHRLVCVSQSTEALVTNLMRWLEAGEAPAVCSSDRFEGSQRKHSSWKRYGNQWIKDCQGITNAEEYREQLSAIAELYVQGYECSYRDLFADGGYKRVPLPTYPFAKERYWVQEKALPQKKITQDQEVAALVSDSNNSIVSSPDAIPSMESVSSPHSSPVKIDSMNGEEPLRQMIFSESWEKKSREEGKGTPPRTLVCFLSEPRRQQAMRQVLQMNSPHTQIVFISKNQLEEYAHSYHALFQEIERTLGTVDAIAYLWPLETIEDIQNYDRLFDWLQGMSKTKIRPKQLLLAGSYTEPRERAYLESWIGLERSLRMVLPKVQVSVLIGEHDPRRDAYSWMDRVWQALQNPGESLVYQGEHRYIRRIRPIEIPSQDSQLRIGGTYVITGGLGGLGRLFAQHLAQHYQGRLILTGRSSLTTKKQEQLKALEDLGGRVRYIQADVCDQEAMRLGLEAARHEWGPIHGVIHAAGVLGKQTIFEKTNDQVHQVLSPKVKGTLVLDALLAEEALDFFCLFSSTSATLGDFGSGDYAMGNRFLTAYARERNQQCELGKRQGKTVAIQWPLWREGRMGTDDNTDMYLRASGQRFLETTEGWDLFKQLISSSVDAPLVLVGQPSRVHRFLGVDLDRQDPSMARDESVPMESDKTEATFINAGPPAKDSQKPMPQGIGRRPEMKGWSVAQCVEWVVTEQVSHLLKVDRKKLDREENLTEFGFDSISLVDFAEQLAHHFTIEITPAVFYEYATIAQVTDYLLTSYPDAVTTLYGEAIETPVAPSSQKEPVTLPSETIQVDSLVESVQEENQQDLVASISSVKDLQAPDKTMTPTFHASSVPEPIAIIGMSGRFPGARNIDELWTHLAEGRNLVTDHPTTRFPEEKQRRWKGGWIPEVAEFDPMFFGITPKEAITMDPRQRLLLQESWNALEDAGVEPEKVEKGRLGMFVGVEQGDYQYLTGMNAPITANHDGVLAARLSYFLNGRGPAMAINTACSSGLVAAHQACQSLRNGECETAIAAGVNLILSSATLGGISQAGMFSEDGTCYAFDKRANGMVPGEAVTVVVLKLLSKAMMDKDPIHAVIRGSGINYDGKTNGITAPNGAAQTELIKHVYDQFQVNPESIHYVVAHGTGTKLGDPVEVNALTQAFKSRTDETKFCALTSVKSNVGHTFAASGLVSLVSLVQAMRHGTIPASLHCEEENPFIQWKDSPFYVNKTAKAWPDTAGQKRRGAVSSFGMSGTNAHMVVENFTPVEEKTPSVERPYHLLVLSAKTEESLQMKVQEMVAALQGEEGTNWDLASVAHTLMTRRHHFNHRCALVIRDQENAIHLLRHAEEKEKVPNLFYGKVPRDFSGIKVLQHTIREMLVQLQSATDHDRVLEMLQALADLYCQGYDIPWKKMVGEWEPQGIHLPTYPFVRGDYWVKQPQPISEPVSTSQSLDPMTKSSGRRTLALPEQTSSMTEMPKAPVSTSLQKPTQVILTETGETTNPWGGNPTEQKPSINLALTDQRIREDSKTEGEGLSQESRVDHPIPSQETIPYTRLLEEVRQSLADALIMERDEIEGDMDFIDLGVDSIIGVEWIQEINQKYGGSLTANVIYDHPNLHLFTQYLHRELQQWTPDMPLDSVQPRDEKAFVAKRVNGSAKEPSIPRETSTPVQESLGEAELAKKLAHLLAEVLVMDLNDVDEGIDFIDMGVDSIIGVEWIQAINTEFGVSLNANAIYDYPNLRAFATYLSHQLSKAMPSLSDVLAQVQNGEMDVEVADQLLQQIAVSTNNRNESPI